MEISLEVLTYKRSTDFNFNEWCEECDRVFMAINSELLVRY